MIARLFIGIELPAQVKHSLHAIAESNGGRTKGLRWVPADNLHLTIKFLGATPVDAIDSLTAELEHHIDNFRKFSFSLSELGAFPSDKRARVLWVGVKHGAAELVSLSRAIEEAAAHAGFPPENKKFTPHITLARLNPPKNIGDFISNTSTTAFSGRFINVGHATLFQSHLSSSGAKYEALKHIALPG